MEDWSWQNAQLTETEHLGRACTRVESVDGMALGIADVELENGVIELDLAVSAERGFHGVVWRVQDDENYESFFVRPHQVGNPDAIQYTPVFNGSSVWQLYHGDGFWAPISFPLDDWFRIRIAFAGARAEVFVGDLDAPALAIRELKRATARGRVGVRVGGPAVHVCGFSCDDTSDITFRRGVPPAAPTVAGMVRAWSVSDAFAANEVESLPLAPRTWTRLAAEPSGLVISRA